MRTVAPIISVLRAFQPFKVLLCLTLISLSSVSANRLPSWLPSASAQSAMTIFSGAPFIAPISIVESPDGATYYIADDIADAIFRLPAAGGMPTVIASGGSLDNMRDMTISADGTMLYIAAFGAGRILRLPTAPNSTPTELASGSPLINPHGIALSPDGGTLYIVDARVGGKVMKMPVTGGTPTILAMGFGTDTAGPHSLCVSPDGATLYIASGTSGIFRLPVGGGPATPLYTVSPIEYATSIDISADGSTLYVLDGAPVLLSGLGAAEIFSLPVTGGTPSLVLSGSPLLTSGFMHRSHDGTKLFVADPGQNNPGGPPNEPPRVFKVNVPVCATPPPGLVSWWRAEGNANDSIGGNHGTVEGTVSFAPGLAGQAFKFNGNQSDGINLGNVSAFDFDQASSFTLEAWVQLSAVQVAPNDASTVLALNFKCNEGGLSVQTLAFGANGDPARAHFEIRGISGGGSLAVAPSSSTLNVWHHLVGVREVVGTSKTLRLYVNGQLQGTVPDISLGALVNNGPDYIGRRYPCGTNNPFNGLIDEVSVYNRALTAEEIQLLYNAGGAGKCLCPLPIVAIDPANQTVSAGGTAFFTAVANGDPTPGVRWQVSADGGANFNDLPGQNSATQQTATLTLANVSFAQNGYRYRAVFTNSCGSVNSAAATLTVTCPNITVEPASLAAGRVGNSYLQVFTQAGGASFRLTAGSLPAGMTLSAAGVLSGTPTAFGNFSFRVRATDANDCFGEREYELVIQPPCGVILISPSSLPGGLVAVAYSQTLTAAGGTGALTWVVSAGALPPGLSLSSSGVLSGAPTAAGTFSFTVKVTDANGCAGSQTYVLVINTCPAISILPATLTSLTAFTFFSQQLTASGGASSYSFAVTAGALPAGLTLTSGGLLSGAPTVAGSFNFTVRATDANPCFGERVYSLTVTANAGLMFYPLPAPVRLLETRSGSGLTGCERPNLPIGTGGTLTVPTRTTCAGIPANAAALTGNVTVVPAGAGFLTLYPGNAPERPQVANSNFQTGEVTNNVFTVGLAGADGTFKIFASGQTHVILDVTGYYAPPTASGLYFHPLASPVRLLETRTGQTGCIAPGAPLVGTGDPNANPNLDLPVQGRSPLASPCNSIPASARVLVGNATSVLPNGGGYLTIYPSDGPRPTVASSNYAGADVINGPFAVKLGADGKFKIYTFRTTDLVVDVLGYYSEDAMDANGAGLLLTALPAPVRLLETRPDFPGFPLPGCTRTNAKIPGNSTMATHTQPARGFCGLPASAQAVVGNATVVNSAGAGFLTLFPGNLTTAPLAATSNYPTPATFGYNRHYFAGLSPAEGTFKALTQFTTDLILDVSGYFAP